MKRFLYVTLLLALLPLASYAQGIAALAEKHNLDPLDVRLQLIEEQLVRSLTSSHDAILMQSLENAIVLAVTHRDRMDINRVSNAIKRVHKKTKNPEIRDMALGALLITGSDQGLQYARAVTKADKDRSRAVAFNIIDHHFASRQLLGARPAAQ